MSAETKFYTEQRAKIKDFVKVLDLYIKNAYIASGDRIEYQPFIEKGKALSTINVHVKTVNGILLPYDETIVQIMTLAKMFRLRGCLHYYKSGDSLITIQ